MLSQFKSQTIVNGQFVLRGTGNDPGANIIQLLDGNYLYCGTTNSYGNGGKDILVVKFQQDFSIVWQKTLGGPNDEFLYDRQICLENSDGTIIITGVSNSGLIGGDDMLLLKLDALGNTIWSNAYGGAGNERSITLEKCLDGGYIIGGSTYSFPVGNNNIYLVKVDTLGNIDWNWSYGSTNQSATQVADIITLPDSSYVISGYYDSSVSPNASGYIARVDKNGVLLWIKRYVYSNNAGWEGVNGLKLVGNNIIATGVTRGLSLSGVSDGLIMSVDFNGSVNWAKAYGSTGNEWFYFLDTDNNQDLTAMVYTNSVGFGGYDIGLIKTDTLGNLIAYKVYGSSGVEHAKFYSQTSDGGVIFTGNTSGFSSTQQDAYIVKMDQTWSTECNDSIESISETTIVLTPQNIVAQQNTNGNEQIVNLSTSNDSIVIDTLCLSIQVLSNFQCNVTANFSTTQFCEGDSTLLTDLSIDSVGNIVNWIWYFGDGDSIVGVQNPSHLYNSSGSFNVMLSVITDSNCTDSITIPITINPTFSSNQNLTICQGDSILLEGVYQTNAGNYIDSLQTVFGCDSVVNTNLTVDSVGVLVVSNDTTTSACQGVQLNVSGGSSYLWSPIDYLSCTSCFDPIASPSTTTTYSVSDPNSSCTLPNFVTVYVDGDAQFFIPNVFTPNGDGSNDLFNVSSDCIYSLSKKVYNRWGELVFMSNQINEGWNGRTTAGAEVPEGTYFYVIEVGYYTSGAITTETFTGYVTLLR